MFSLDKTTNNKIKKQIKFSEIYLVKQKVFCNIVKELIIKPKQMRAYNFTKGKKEIKKYREISNINQGVYSKGEVIRAFESDKLFINEVYNTRFEEVK